MSFVEHTFLYHIRRLDHRHNFSPYFYSFYLSTAENTPLLAWNALLRHPLAAFVPQLGLSTALGFVLGAEDLAFAWLVQTLTFVTFNKVCTSQVCVAPSV
jgi:phosphatidylinositol glycan class M